MRGKMNSQIIEEYNRRPKKWFYYLLIFIILLPELLVNFIGK